MAIDRKFILGAAFEDALSAKAWQSEADDIINRVNAYLQEIESVIPGDIDPSLNDKSGKEFHCRLECHIKEHVYILLVSPNSGHFVVSVSGTENVFLVEPQKHNREPRKNAPFDFEHRWQAVNMFIASVNKDLAKKTHRPDKTLAICEAALNEAFPEGETQAPEEPEVRK